jgi:hypothetical protein
MNELLIKYNKCLKDKCEDKIKIFEKDKKLMKINNNIINYKDIEKNIIELYSNKKAKDLLLCGFKNCKFTKKIQDKYLKFINNSIKFFDIKLSTKLKKQLDKLIELSSKPSLTDEEYINKIILLRLFNRIASINLFKSKIKIFKLLKRYINCSDKYCKEFNIEAKELQDKKLSIIKIKNDKKRNEYIKEIFSNEKQVKLDKCVTNKCNKVVLKLIQESLKFFNDSLKLFDIKVPKDIQMSNIIELKEDDIPEIIIKINKLSYFLLLNIS